MSARRQLDTVLHKTTVRFLNLIFEKPALVFQSLYLEYGSQQPGHQDSAYVPLSSPMQLAASWTALEDIRPGSGELFVQPKSQTIPEFLFEGRYKNQPTGSSESRLYTEHLINQVALASFPETKFEAAAGDVLIWAADTIHGGSKITDPAATRRSLVAHYCPIDVRPQYFDETCTVRKYTEEAAYTFAESATVSSEKPRSPARVHRQDGAPMALRFWGDGIAAHRHRVEPFRARSRSSIRTDR